MVLSKLRQIVNEDLKDLPDDTPITVDETSFRTSVIELKIFTQVVEEGVFMNIASVLNTQIGAIHAEDFSNNTTVLDIEGNKWTVITVVDIYID